MKKFILILIIVIEVLLLALAGLLIFRSNLLQFPQAANTEPPVQATAPPPQTQQTETQAPATEPPTTEPPTTEPPPTEPPFEPGYTEDSDPANWNMTWDVMVGDTLVESYTREEEIFFDDGNYFALPGVASFRGGNYRTDASYGTADITEGAITQLWHMSVGYLESVDWIGCGWTGQPLAVQWDAETRAIMNLYEDKKEKEDLVEAIYAKMDGWIHFIDMEDGSYTRDPLFIGMVFKGSGALDPRGYPILYVGAGLQQYGKTQHIFAISLIDGSILYELNGYDSFAPRSWFGFDSAPLVDAETDTLIWPCESGVLYTIKLNTLYDKAAGTISMNPDEPVKSRYVGDYQKQGRYAGYESSVTAVENYLYLGDNSGMLQCVDINTMELIWAQDITDDINSTTLFDWGEDGRGYVYTAPSLDYSNGGSGYGSLPVCKLDAQTGQILWTHYFDCVTADGVPGGVLSSPLLGMEGSNIENLIIYSVGRSPSAWTGQVVAFDKQTGEIVWQYQMGNYMWSSPVALYTEDGKGYIFQSDAFGACYLMDGLTGEILDKVKLDRTVESSPVVFGNRVLIGTRSSIHLFEIS